MKDYKVPIPANIAKHGIKKIVADHGPDQQVALPRGFIFSFFKDELVEKFVTGGERIEPTVNPHPHKHKPTPKR